MTKIQNLKLNKSNYHNRRLNQPIIFRNRFDLVVQDVIIDFNYQNTRQLVIDRTNKKGNKGKVFSKNKLNAIHRQINQSKRPLPNIIIQDIPNLPVGDLDIPYFTIEIRRHKANLTFYRLPILRTFTTYKQLYNLVNNAILELYKITNKFYEK
ncbi:MAG: hypothetical protein LBT99_00805 [Bifidobacteriaceae bacterium]|nr:hypothetical protein [Bifidobacteriaceae bacterium]